MPAVVIYTRFANRRIKEYAIRLYADVYLTDEHGRVLRYSQKAAALDRLKLL